MYSPKAPLPNPIAIATEKLSPQATQTSDSTSSSRCRRMIVTVPIQVDRRGKYHRANATHAPTGTSRSTNCERSVVASIVN